MALHNLLPRTGFIGTKHHAGGAALSRGPSTFRQRDVTRAIKATTAAGIDISRIEIDKDGKIVVIVGKPDAPDDAKEIVL